MTGYDPHRDVSSLLSEMRTLLTRAHTARDRLGDSGFVSGAWHGYLPHGGDDLKQMRAALDQMVTLLEPWARVKSRREEST